MGDTALNPGILRFRTTERPTPYGAYCLPVGHREWGHSPIAAWLQNLPELGIRTVYTPNVSESNARIRLTELLTRTTRLGGLDFKHDSDLPTDGLAMLKPGEACAILAAGCTKNVISTPSGLIVFHGSRESWVDRNLLENGTESRAEMTVLHEAVACMRMQYGIRPTDATFDTFFSIDPLDFPHPEDHPVHGTYNARLADYMKKHLPEEETFVNRDGIPHFDLSTVATGWAQKFGFSKVRSHCPLPRHENDGFVTAASPLGRQGRRNLVCIYVPMQ